MAILLRLHRRIYHIPPDRLSEMLQRIGVSSKVRDMTKEAVGRCSICRKWSRPGPRNKVSSTLRTRFNEEIQIDLFFIGKDIQFLHIIDVATRFGLA